MALTDFQAKFDNAYQEIFDKVLVAKAIMNTRFEASLKFGESVERFAYDISGVVVRSVVRGSDSTVDVVTDNTELLTINLEKEAVFFLSDGEMTQAGPLNPGEVIGGKIAVKVAADLDARCFAEVLNAYQTFDTGDLTTLVSTGVPFALTSTTVPQMITRMPAKLKKGASQTMTNMALVIDSYGAGDIEQYLLGKQFSIVESVFKNGYSGPMSQAEVYVSDNLTGTVLLTDAALGNDDTFVINGVTFTAKTTLGTAAGNFALGANNTAALANLVTLLNAPGTTNAVQVALSAANQALFADTYRISALAVTAATSLKITSVGGGRITATATGDSSTVTLAAVHAYYGKKGAIDLVIQDFSKVDMRQTSTKRGMNIFTSYLAGLKTFADGAKQFLDVLIAV